MPLSIQRPPAFLRRVGHVVVWATVWLCSAAASAQTSSTQTHPSNSQPRGQPSTGGYRIGKAPGWVKPVRANSTSTVNTPATAGLGYRLLLVDTQTRLSASSPEQTYTRTLTLATEAYGVQVVSKAELDFNPAYQMLTLHEASITRHGTKLDRLKEARIELLRREAALERQTLTGVQTLLVVLSDVRIGDVVELAYTVQGANPIFKGHFAETYQLGFSAPADEQHLRIDYPRGMTLRSRGIRAQATPEMFEEDGHQVMRLVQHNVPAVVAEENVPPWFKIYPALHVSDYADWQAVATWADELFANPGELGTELQSRIATWRASGLPPDQLVSVVLEFVQDEVRYFSVSLGESSHRPKTPARTLAERLGDCKDKVALLNAILKPLGFDAKPALISVSRNRGVADYLPSHDQFDHVITQLNLNGTVYWLDPTMQKQGRKLENRGFVAYGLALVVDPKTQALTQVEPPSGLERSSEFDQRWDASDLTRPVQFTTILRARGLAAESWRSSVSAGGVQRLASSLGGAYARMWPSLQSVAEPVVRDNRDTNLFELELRYEVPGFGQYDRGALAVDVPTLELLDLLTGPREAKRNMPYLLDQPSLLRQHLHLVAPSRFTSKAPAPAEVNDKHFNVSARYEIDGATLDYVLTYERRRDEVLPADLPSYRERVQAARKLGGVNVRLPLLDFNLLRKPFEDIDRRVQHSLGQQSDTLREIVMRQEVERLLATETLKLSGESGPLIGAALERRAIANSMLNDFLATLADADLALATAPEAGYSHYTRGLALLSLGRAEEAAAAMQQYKNPANRALLDRGIGSALYYQGQYAQAEQVFKQAAQESSGDDRSFALLWLYLSAQRSSTRGQASLQPFLGSIDKNAWPGVLVHYLAGASSQDEVLQLARLDKRMARLQLTEAYFYLGQHLLLNDQSNDARRMFQRAVDIKATPDREHALADLELKRTSNASMAPPP